MSYNEHLRRYFAACYDADFSNADIDALRRDAQRISSWDVHECNGTIQWAEEGDTDHRGRKLKAGRPYSVHGQDNPHCPPKGIWSPRRDTYTPAMARVRAIAEKYGATLEYNGDPRGWPFVLRMPDGKRDIVPPVRG
jgi:hypothetical protein